MSPLPSRRKDASRLAWPVSPEDIDRVSVVDLQQPLAPQVLALQTSGTRRRQYDATDMLSLFGALAGVAAAVAALASWLQ